MNEPLITIRKTAVGCAVRRYANGEEAGGGAAGQQAGHRVSADINTPARSASLLYLARKLPRT